MNDSHRLPGMSVDRATWDALTDLADQLGITRSRLIRTALYSMIDATDADQSQRLAKLELENTYLRDQLSAVRAVFEPDFAA